MVRHADQHTHPMQHLTQEQYTLKLAHMHSMLDTVSIHAHLLPTGAFSASDTLLHLDAFAHEKGPIYGHNKCTLAAEDRKLDRSGCT